MVWAILNPDVAAGLKELSESTSDRVTAIMGGAVASPPSSHRVSHQEGARYLLGTFARSTSTSNTRACMSVDPTRIH